MTPLLEQDIRAALAYRADLVPDDSVDLVRRAHYAPRRFGFGRQAAVAGAFALAVVVAGAAAAATIASPGTSHHPPAATQAVTVAYVGSHPRLAVSVLPAGFRASPNVPIPGLGDQTSGTGRLPQKTFVRLIGSVQENIGVAEGPDSDGAVAKLLSIATRDPAAASQQTIGQQTYTIIDLEAAGAGTGEIVYFPVGPSTWAFVSGGPEVTTSELLAVAVGLKSAGS
jgi:hypothetical protein